MIRIQDGNLQLNRHITLKPHLGSGGISIGHKDQNYEEPEQRHFPRTVLVIDNYNVQIGNARWGKEQKIDVVHALGKTQEIFAPPNLSSTHPSLPLKDLTGVFDTCTD